MVEEKDLSKIKEAIEEFFDKMTMSASSVEASLSDEKESEVVDVAIKLDEPQILIGQAGQTLFEIQRILRTVLNKKLGKIFYLNVDINDYKKKKVEYLKDMAKDLADQVASSKEEKELPAMSAYERRIIHAELSQRIDVVTESQGDGLDRHIVIKLK